MGHHILRGGEVLSSHKSLKTATAAYLKLLDELGLSAKAVSPTMQAPAGATPASRLVGDYYVYGKSKRRRTGTRTYG